PGRRNSAPWHGPASRRTSQAWRWALEFLPPDHRARDCPWQYLPGPAGMLGRHEYRSRWAATYERRSRWAATYERRSRWAATLTIATMAMPHVMDPMWWIGPGGPFASAVLPGILVIVFIETGLLFPVLPGDSLLFPAGLLAAGGTMNIWTLVILVPLVAI